MPGRTDGDGSRREITNAGARTNWTLDGETITVFIPMTWKRRGGQKVIIAPDSGDAWTPAQVRSDETLIRTLAQQGMSIGGSGCWMRALSAAASVEAEVVPWIHLTQHPELIGSALTISSATIGPVTSCALGSFAPALESNHPQCGSRKSK